MTKEITAIEFKEALPAHMKKNVNTHLLDKVNTLIASDTERETFRDNIIGLSHVLKEGKFKLDNYINAVRFISYTMMGKSNQESYSLTFPDKMRQWQQLNKSPKDISSAVAIYNKSKLVNLVREAAMIPVHVYNVDLFNEALSVQANLMRDQKVSPMVRQQAAACLIKELRPPETQKVELDIAVKEDSAIAALRDTTAKFVAEQKAMINGGIMNAKDVAERQLDYTIEGESEEVK